MKNLEINIKAVKLDQIRNQTINKEYKDITSFWISKLCTYKGKHLKPKFWRDKNETKQPFYNWFIDMLIAGNLSELDFKNYTGISFHVSRSPELGTFIANKYSFRFGVGPNGNVQLIISF